MTYLTLRPNQTDFDGMFNSFFDDFFAPNQKLAGSCASAGADRSFSPRVDIVDSKDDVKLLFELPGMSKDEIKVSLNNDLLTVSGERVAQSDEKDTNYVTREIRSGSFSRSFTLPDTVNRDAIAADYNNGLLELTLGKLEEVKPKQIEVKVS